MKPLIILGCSGKKRNNRSPASDLYLSDRFTIGRNICKEYSEKWLILSAKYGLIDPSAIVDPYDLTLSDLDNRSVEKWVIEVSNDIKSVLLEKQPVIFIGDPTYFKDVSKNLIKQNIIIYIPFKHISKFRRCEWLKGCLRESKRTQDLNRMYELLNQKAFKDKFHFKFPNLSGGKIISKRGVYLFTMDSEARLFHSDIERIVRVGTHAVSYKSKSTLWQRLKTHRGKNNGSGNHRSSVFRLHIGSSIINKESLVCPTWGIGQSKPEFDHPIEPKIERLVSEYMLAMSVMYISVNDKASKFSDRAYLEQNMIALISEQRIPLDVADENWLGFNCINESVQKSSIWNVNYTDKHYDPRFIDVLEKYIDFMIKGDLKANRSIAPKNWWFEAKSNYKQMMLSI